MVHSAKQYIISKLCYERKEKWILDLREKIYFIEATFKRYLMYMVLHMLWNIQIRYFVAFSKQIMKFAGIMIYLLFESKRSPVSEFNID